jgi:hypothetical protein
VTIGIWEVYMGMRNKKYLLLLSIIFLCGCGESDTPSEEPLKDQKTESIKENKKQDIKKQDIKKQDIKKQDIKKQLEPQNASFNPLKEKTLFEICNSVSLSLIKWSYDQRQSKAICCSEKMTEDQKSELLCELDWPFSDVPSCSSYDTMRNEIYAQYGRKFSTDKWKKYFSKVSWYKPRDDYQDTWLSDVALDNVKRLVKMKKNKQGCMD